MQNTITRNEINVKNDRKAFHLFFGVINEGCLIVKSGENLYSLCIEEDLNPRRLATFSAFIMIKSLPTLSNCNYRSFLAANKRICYGSKLMQLLGVSWRTCQKGGLSKRIWLGVIMEA